MSKIKIFYPSDAKIHMDALESFNVPLNVPMIDLNEGYSSCEICVTFGVPKKVGHRGELVKKIFDAHDGRHIILEVGFMGYFETDNPDKYYNVGWNGIGGYGDYKNAHSPPDRWNDINSKFFNGFQKFSGGDKILFCGQMPSDANVQHIDYIKWCENTVDFLKDFGDVVFRPHPGYPDMFKLPNVVYSTTKSLSEDLVGSKVCITYNSMSGLYAIMEGVPVFAFDRYSPVWDVSEHMLSNIMNPYIPSMDEKIRWACDTAYTQWTLGEMREGLPHKHLGVFK
jgi:hypothetical protein